MTTKCESITIRREDDDELGLFIYAVATLTFERDGTTLVQELKSGGLGDVQGDEAYLVLVGEEQRAELVEMLATLGLGDPDQQTEPGPIYRAQLHTVDGLRECLAYVWSVTRADRALVSRSRDGERFYVHVQDLSSFEAIAPRS